MRYHACRALLFVLISSVMMVGALAAEDGSPKRVLLVGQKRDHPPGSHQYMAGLRVLSACLQQIPGMEVRMVQADEPWPEGPQLLQDVDAVVLYLGQGGQWIQADPERLAAVNRLAQGTTGIVAIHWAIGAKEDRFIAPYLDIIGCMHGGADRKYVISENDVVLESAEHPILRGVEPLRIDDEWYYQLKRSKQGTIQPLLAAVIDGNRETVAWAYTRAGGGRSFGFSGMHYHRNWEHPGLRRMIVQAVLWTLELPIPEQGLPVDVPASVFVLEPEE